MTVEDLDRFDPTDPLTSNDEELDGSPIQIKLRKVRAANSYVYKIGEYESSTYYRQFLSDKLVRTPGGRRITVRHMTDRISRMPKSTFRAWFRMPLFKVVEIADRFIAEGWLGLSHHCRQLQRLQMKAELLVMGTLAMIGGTIQSFRQLKTLTHMSATEHSKFFLTFVEKMASISNEYIYMPRTPEELNEIMKCYEEVGLPGAVGSLDVVHVKWSNCPAGDHNRAKGKESYPSLAFECITDFDRRILGVFGPQFGSQNDKHVVKLDPNIRAINEGWLSKVNWQYYSEDGTISTATGVYVICDNGYICWPTTICPYMRSNTNNRLEDYFSTRIESVRKDVECVFGILKARWACLDNGFKYREMKICGDIFLTCAVLHNMMLTEMVREGRPPRIERGRHLARDGMWLEGPSEEMLPVPSNARANRLKEAFDQRRMQLSHHLKVWKERNTVT
jgi:hypothetical protein